MDLTLSKLSLSRSFSNSLSKIIYFLFTNSLGVIRFKTAQIDKLFLVIVLIDLIIYLPCDVVVDLLEHFLILIVIDLAISLALAVIIFLINFAMHLAANVFKFLDESLVFYSHYVLGDQLEHLLVVVLIGG